MGSVVDRKRESAFLNWGNEPCRGLLSSSTEGAFCIQAVGSLPRVVVSTDGSGVVGHAGACLLAELAHATGLTHAYSTAMGPLCPRGTGRDPGPSAADLAVMLVVGGETITDLAVLESTWLELSLAAIDLLAWRRTSLLDGDLAATEPRKLRHRLLYVTARLTLGGR